VTDLVVWILGIFAVAAAGGTIWYLFREQPQSSNTNELYQHALEKWLDGELAEATTLLTQVVQTNPTAMEPFLQLGNLLRLQGDPARAAVLHRGLTVRQNLSKGEKVLIGLALAEDLIDLEEWGDAGAVLDSLVRHASQQTRYWRARFRQFHGQDKRPDAARLSSAAPRLFPKKIGPGSLRPTPATSWTGPLSMSAWEKQPWLAHASKMWKKWAWPQLAPPWSKPCWPQPLRIPPLL